MSTIDFGHLRLLAIFSTVIEAGSFAAAARKLGSSRSRISEQISALEADLGVRLLQRSTRQLQITTEGQKVYEQARLLPDILHGVEAITTPSVPSGRVAITMNHDIGHKYLLPVLSEFQQQYPQVELDLILDDAPLDLIAEQIDLAIRIGVPKDESLIARVMHEEKFELFASPELLQQWDTPDTIEQLERMPWVTLLTGGGSNIQQLRYRDSALLIKPAETYRCNSPLMVQQMVVQGLGVGALLPSTVSESIEQGDLVRLMQDVSSETMVFSLVYPSRRQLPSRTRVLVDYLLQKQIFSQG